MVNIISEVFTAVLAVFLIVVIATLLDGYLQRKYGLKKVVLFLKIQCVVNLLVGITHLVSTGSIYGYLSFLFVFIYIFLVYIGKEIDK